MHEAEMHSETVKEKVARLLAAETEEQGGRVYIKTKRMLEITAYNKCFACEVEHNISFEDFLKNGSAINKAEIFLLPQEYLPFCFAWDNHHIPFPAQYRQWQRTTPHIISVCFESVEPPEYFAERLSDALQVIEQISHQKEM